MTRSERKIRGLFFNSLGAAWYLSRTTRAHDPHSRQRELPQRSLVSGGTHIRHREPYCWKWTSSADHRSIRGSAANFRSFFKTSLFFRIGPRDFRPWLAKPKAESPEQSLALTHAQSDPPLLTDKRRQGLTIPQITGQAEVGRSLPEGRIDLRNLLFAQPPWTSGNFSIPTF